MRNMWCSPFLFCDSYCTRLGRKVLSYTVCDSIFCVKVYQSLAAHLDRLVLYISKSSMTTSLAWPTFFSVQD
uniref:Uncharacterized protein n=1 Tax=Arundo donax TaxID=35708 RepID=A0A0A9E7P8_ARUDO